MIKYKKYETKLEIEWIDSGYKSGWGDKEQIQEEINNNEFHEDCKSIGYYVYSKMRDK